MGRSTAISTRVELSYGIIMFIQTLRRVDTMVRNTGTLPTQIAMQAGLPFLDFTERKE